MKNTLNHYIRNFQDKHKSIRLYLAVFLVLAAGIFLVVSWKLHHTGISMTADYQCGYTAEHVHTDACYTKTLVCQKEETDGQEGHTHTESCYEEKTTLNCEKEEHVHGQECYDEDGTLICEKEEHTHTENCYYTEREQICGKEEQEPVPAHHHTEECYKTELACTIPEHTHTVECLIDETADVETEADWESTIPQNLTENWAENVVLIAQSQMGYQESRKNFRFADDGTTRKGYTRYGAWYGNEYGDWCAMFAAFCIRYAGIPAEQMPVNSGCAAWISELKNAGMYVESQTKQPKSGDLVFFDLDQDGSADHVGIVEKVQESGTLKVVEGNSADMVKENEWATEDAKILGYGLIPENPLLQTQKEVKTEEKAAEEMAADAEEPEHTEDTVNTANTANTDAPETESDETSQAETPKEQRISMSEQVTGLTGGETRYDADRNVYSSDLKVDFNFQREQIEKNGYQYYYEYPEGVIIPNGLLDGKNHDLYDVDGKKAGTYQFEKTESGAYRLDIDFEQAYVAAAGETIQGFVQFSGEIDGTKADGDGNIKLVGKDQVTLDIPKESIKYPDNETNHYDISTKKNGFYEIKNGKLIYTVYVTSLKGTPETIDFQDVIQVEGMKLGSPEITVTKETVSRYYGENGSWWDSNPITEETMENQESTSENGTIRMTLPKIEPAQEKTDNNGGSYKEYTRYKIVYTYEVTNLNTEQPTAKNIASASSENDKTKVKSSAETNITIQNKHTLEKTGSFDAAENQIIWKITLNRNHLNLADSGLTDEMLAKLADGTDVTIQPAEGYEITRDESGNITGIRFTAEEGKTNTGEYTITYRTKAEPSWDSREVKNTATFQPGDGSAQISTTGTVWIGGGEIAKAVGSAEKSADGTTMVLPWKVTLTVPESGILSGTSIVDDPTKNQWGGAGGTHYLTKEQVQAWTEGIYWADAEENRVETVSVSEIAEISFQASDGKSYTLNEILDHTTGNADSLTYTICKMTLKDTLTVPSGAKKLIFAYKTTANIADASIGSTWFCNKIRVGQREAYADYEYKKGGIVKTDENGSAETTSKKNADGMLTWKIMATLEEKSSMLSVLDTLPEGVELEEIRGESNLSGMGPITISKDGAVSGGNSVYQITGTQQNREVRLKLTRADAQNGTKLDAGVYTLVVKCKVSKEKLDPYAAGETYSFRNHAEATSDKGSMGSTDQTQQWTEDTAENESKVVDKTGVWDNDSRRVKYSICLNPDGRDLVNGADTLTLTDVMQYYTKMGVHSTNWSDKKTLDLSAWLVPGSVKLYRAEKQKDGTVLKGDEIKNWTWTVQTSVGNPDWQGGTMTASTLTANGLPDETPMILEYDYQFQADVPRGYTGDYAVRVFNSAQLDGTAYKDDEYQNDVIWKEQTHTGQVSTEKRCTLYKVSKGDYGTTLAGAVFQLQKYDGTGYVNTGISYTTDTDGKIIIQWQKEDADLSYEKNVLYRLVETNAPKDYLLPENPEENAVYFYFSEDGNTANTLPKELPKQAFDLTKTSQIIYIENEKNETPVYELPESGGSGTTLFTVSGITLMGIAVLYGISSLGRRRERGGK